MPSFPWTQRGDCHLAVLRRLSVNTHRGFWRLSWTSAGVEKVLHPQEALEAALSSPAGLKIRHFWRGLDAHRELLGGLPKVSTAQRTL